LQSLLAFVFVLGVLILVMSWGIFSPRAGSACASDVLARLGPKVLVRRGDTEYCLSAIPLGSYVNGGENPGDHRRAS
jgi:membrane-associated protease RseP (regulator of RpoE activity)